jgi:serine/threonine protein kinase
MNESNPIININPETHYTLLETLGKGSFGTVHRGLDKRTSKIVAIKIINMEGIFEHKCSYRRQYG